MPDDTSRSQVAVLTTAEYKTYAVVSEALLQLEASIVAAGERALDLRGMAAGEASLEDATAAPLCRGRVHCSRVRRRSRRCMRRTSLRRATGTFASLFFASRALARVAVLTRA